MKIIKTKFKGLLIIKQKNNSDSRGNLRETFNKRFLRKKLQPLRVATKQRKFRQAGARFGRCVCTRPFAKTRKLHSRANRD